MKYDFETLINREHTDCAKWDEFPGKLPMWVADMDFPVAPCIIEAMKKRIEHPIFGYAYPGEDWYEAWINFIYRRHHYRIEKEWMFFATGVIPIISSTVRKLTSEGDNVLVLTPIYKTFFNSIVNNNRTPLESKMIYQNNEYFIDWADLEEKLSLDKTTLMIFCNPHNPTGKIWDVETMKRIGELCYKYGVPVISDEIHSELVKPGLECIPFSSVSEINQQISITCLSISKWFNMASLQAALCYIPNPELKKKVERQLNTDECAEPNAFACPVTIAALNDGNEWLDEVNEVIEQNRKYLEKFIDKNIKNISYVHGEATYLIWLDISKISRNSSSFCSFLAEKYDLVLSDGRDFKGDGNYFVRINIACPKSLLIEGLNRLKLGAENYHGE